MIYNLGLSAGHILIFLLIFIVYLLSEKDEGGEN